MKDIYLLLTVVKRKDGAKYEEFYRRHGVKVIYDTRCNGTAHARTLNILGIERTEKSLLIATVTGPTIRTLKKDLSYEMKIDLPDRGVAMAIPLSGIGGSRTLEYFTSGQCIPEEHFLEDRQMEGAKELIIAIYQKGYTDVVMDAARAAGAGGGTTISAKGTVAGTEKFFGIALAEEKEIVMIVSTAEQKKDIMKAIMQNAGVDTKAHAVVFSLPVTDTAGFRFADTVEKE